MIEIFQWVNHYLYPNQYMLHIINASSPYFDAISKQRLITKILQICKAILFSRRVSTFLLKGVRRYVFLFIQRFIPLPFFIHMHLL